MRPKIQHYPQYNSNDARAPQNDTSPLLALGRRIERLIFIGIILTAICFAESYVTTANKQYSDDKTAAAISSLLDKMQKQRNEFDALYSKSKMPKAPEPQPIPTYDTSKFSDTRKKLGLPPAKSPQKQKQEPLTKTDEQTYRDALFSALQESARQAGTTYEIIGQFYKPETSPGELINILQIEKSEIEEKALYIWSIRTPRAIGIQYAGSNFQLQYNFISSALLIFMSPIIAGWMSTFYITRQREISEITKSKTASSIFPHVLNFIPIHYKSINNNIEISKTHKVIIITYLCAIRTAIIITITSPMLLAHIYAINQLGDYPYITYIAVVFIIYTLLQLLLLALQDCYGLRRVLIVEK